MKRSEISCNRILNLLYQAIKVHNYILDTARQINYNKCCHTVSGFRWYLIIKGELDNAGKQVV